MAEAPVESVRRAIHLLHELNRQRVSSVRHLHHATGLPKPTIVRLLDTLIALGYVVNDRRQGGYQVTSLVRSLSAGFHGDPLVVEAARPVDDRLHAQVSVAGRSRGTRPRRRGGALQHHPRQPGIAVPRDHQHPAATDVARAGAGLHCLLSAQ